MEENVVTLCGSVAAVCIAPTKGVQKDETPEAVAVVGKGLEGDGHFGFAHRQVSFLSEADILDMKQRLPSIRFGSFAENLVLRDIDSGEFRIGDRLRIGETLLEVTQIGKVCHSHCAIYYATGDCIMPRKGVFCAVLEGGRIRAGDRVIATLRRSAPE